MEVSCDVWRFGLHHLKRRIRALQYRWLALVALLCGIVAGNQSTRAQDAPVATPNRDRSSEVEPIITDRPDFTESTETVPSGKTQIEGGITFTRAGDERNNTFGELLVRHALGPKTELRFEVPTFSRSRGSGSRQSGFEDGSIGFKRMLSQGSGDLGFRKPRVSLIGSMGVPIGAHQFRGSGLQPEVKLLFGVDLSERLSLSSNLNYAYRKDSARFHEFSGSVSLGMGLTERLGSYVEVFGFVPGGNRDKNKFINGGFTFAANNELQLDARLGFGLNNRVRGPDYFFGVGAAQRF